MSVTPTNSDLESVTTTSAPSLNSIPRNGTGKEHDGREALEALLAFSALHQQIRECRRLEKHDEVRGEDSRQLEQFVLDEVLQLVAERALTITGVDGVAIALAQENAIVCRASAGKVSPDHGMRIDLNSGFSGACLTSGQIVRCDDTESDSRVNAQACRTLGARSMLAVPLSAKQRVVGLIEAFATEAYGFNDSDVRSLSLLAELILAALRPEEEDRLAEVSEQVVSEAKAKPAPSEPANLKSIEQAEIIEEPAEVPEVATPIRAAKVAAPSRPGLGVVAALIVFAALLGAGLWWRMSRSASSTADARMSPPLTVQVKPAAAVESAAASVPATSEPALDEDVSPPKPLTLAKLAALPEVTGIRHWSSEDSSTVAIDLQDQVQYEAHRLANPERIYFDLPDTRLAAELFGKSIEIGDPLIQRVRVAQPVAGVTRVVLETKGASNFSVSLETNPYRLVVEIRKVGIKPEAKSKLDLFMPGEGPVAESASHTLAPRLRIVLDAGHGGWDLGTVGRAGLLEKDLALDIVGRLGKLVEHRLGAEVIYTRKDDSYIPLEKRTETANLSGADLFLSIHANYSEYQTARGVETYYTNTYSSIKARPEEDEAALKNVNWTGVDIRQKVHESHRFAADVQHALYGTLVKQNPGLPNRGVKQAQYVVLTGTTMPAVLAEISFVSSPTDENNLQNASYRQRIANALYEGVAAYAAEFHKNKLASLAK